MDQAYAASGKSFTENSPVKAEVVIKALRSPPVGGYAIAHSTPQSPLTQQIPNNSAPPIPEIVG